MDSKKIQTSYKAIVQTIKTESAQANIFQNIASKAPIEAKETLDQVSEGKHPLCATNFKSKKKTLPNANQKRHQYDTYRTKIATIPQCGNNLSKTFSNFPYFQ